MIQFLTCELWVIFWSSNRSPLPPMMHDSYKDGRGMAKKPMSNRFNRFPLVGSMHATSRVDWTVTLRVHCLTAQQLTQTLTERHICFVNTNNDDWLVGHHDKSTVRIEIIDLNFWSDELWLLSELLYLSICPMSKWDNSPKRFCSNEIFNYNLNDQMNSSIFFKECAGHFYFVAIWLCNPVTSHQSPGTAWLMNSEFVFRASSVSK